MRGSNGAVRYGTVRYGAVRCRDTVRYGAAGNQPCGAVHGYGYGAVRFRDTVRCSHLRPGYAVRLRYSPNAVRSTSAIKGRDAATLPRPMRSSRRTRLKDFRPDEYGRFKALIVELRGRGLGLVTSVDLANTNSKH